MVWCPVGGSVFMQGLIMSMDMIRVWGGRELSVRAYTAPGESLMFTNSSGRIHEEVGQVRTGDRDETFGGEGFV